MGFRSRLFFLITVFALIVSLVVAGFWYDSDTAVADSVDQPISEPLATARRDRDDLLIVYSNEDTRVTYGEYSEIELNLVGRIPDDWDIFWYPLNAPLPAGLRLDSSQGRQLLVYGTPKFLGKWCLTIAAEVERLQTSRDVCFYAADDNNLGAPTFHSDRKLPVASKNERYNKKIRFPSGRHYQIATVWSNLPNSLRLEISDRRGYLRIKGTPTDRTSYRARNYSSHPHPEVDIYTVDDYRSRFHREVRKNYRITAVYEDGETNSHVNLVTVDSGEIVVASIDYDHKPFYFNIFRNDLDGVAHKFIGRITPTEPGAEYLIDSNRVTPRTISAEGVFYLTLRLSNNNDRHSRVTYKQFALTVLPKDYHRGRYRCPAGYYYDRVARHCVQDRGSTCPAGSYYEPEFNRCRDYLDHCPRGYYFDHFLGFCVNIGFPRCPYNYRWDPIFQSCEFSPVWCPFGFRYNWFTGRCQLNYRRSCPEGWHYNRALDRCLRNRRACAEGYTWDRRSKSCRSNYRRCQRDHHWSERLNRCVFHGNRPRCPANHRYQPSTGRCVRIGGTRRCQSGYRWSHRLKKCVSHSRQGPRPTARPTRTSRPEPTARPTRRPRPTARPTRTSRPEPTARPTRRPTARPTRTSRPEPTARPTRRPTARPTRTPDNAPTIAPDRRPRPTARPTRTPRPRPTARPTRTSRPRPTARPTRTSRPRPTARPTRTSRPRPTARPTRTSRPRPTARPTRTSRPRPTARPTRTSRPRPTARPTRTSRPRPTARPTRTSRPRPTARPTRTSRPRPTARPTRTSRPRPRPPNRNRNTNRNEVVIPAVVTE